MKLSESSSVMPEELQRMGHDLINKHSKGDVVSFCLCILSHVAKNGEPPDSPIHGLDPLTAAIMYLHEVDRLNIARKPLRTVTYIVTGGRDEQTD